MKFLILSLLALGYQTASAQLVTESFGSGDNAFTMDFVTIGNPNNVADTTGSPNPAGSVGYIYNLGKYEVSRKMIDKANAAGDCGITMYDSTTYGGDAAYFSREPNSAATGVNWHEAARFVNFLNINKGYQAAYLFDASGNFKTWSSAMAGGNNLFRHKDAQYFLPSVDEWYKAAYGNPNGIWSNFANGNDTEPTAIVSGTAANTAVYGRQTGPPDLPDITSSGGLSVYGTMGQGGGVWEWNETAYDGINDTEDENRSLRGGAWDSLSFDLNASNGFSIPASVDGTNGFRVASVPEPSSLSLLALGGVVVALRRRR